MKIDLQYPYSEDWRMGYLVTNPEGRRTVILFNSQESRSSTQYARYLCAVRLGRYLSESETADHIDGDKTNDSMENLQVITLSENIRKSSKRSVKEHGTLSMYRYCKCDLCKQAKKDYMAKYNKDKR